MLKLVEDYKEKARIDGVKWEISQEVKAKAEDQNYRNQVLSKTGFPDYIGIAANDEDWESIIAIYEARAALGKEYENNHNHFSGTSNNSLPSSNNSVAMLLKVFAIILYIGGFISGISLGKDVNVITGEATFSITLTLAYWIGFFGAGTMMYGFAEIVRLLQVIADK